MKKQYKLIKKYPNFQNNIELGLVVTKGEHSEAYYSNTAHVFSAEEVEDYPEFWSKVVEPIKLVKPIGTVFIVKGDKYSWVNYLLTPGYDVKAYPNHVSHDNMKTFSTKEKAEEYILMNKPCLSVADVMRVIHHTDTIKYSELKLKELAKSKI